MKFRILFIKIFNLIPLKRTRSDESLYTKFNNSDENGMNYQNGQQNGTNGIKKDFFGLSKQPKIPKTDKNVINKGQNGLKKVNNGIFEGQSELKKDTPKAKFNAKIDQNGIKKEHITLKKDKAVIKKGHEGLNKKILTQYYGLMSQKQDLLEDAYQGVFDMSKMDQYLETFSKFILELPKNIVDQLGSKKLIVLINGDKIS